MFIVQVPTVYKIGLLKFFFYHAGFQIYFLELNLIPE